MFGHKVILFFCLVKECTWYGVISSLIFCVELNHSIYCLMRYDTTSLVRDFEKCILLKVASSQIWGGGHDRLVALLVCNTPATSGLAIVILDSHLGSYTSLIDQFVFSGHFYPHLCAPGKILQSVTHHEIALGQARLTQSSFQLNF
jgi:hypothetical protein